MRRDSSVFSGCPRGRVRRRKKPPNPRRSRSEDVVRPGPAAPRSALLAVATVLPPPSKTAPPSTLRQPLDPRFEQWQRSFPFDQKLLLHELSASRAHAQALGAAGVLNAEEWGSILTGLDQIKHKSETDADFFNDPEAEDVHHFVEKRLVELIGDTGKKLHSGRSRNEQIATDSRLFVRGRIDVITTQLTNFMETLLTRAEDAKLAVMPAHTHLQRAEPVLMT